MHLYVAQWTFPSKLFGLVIWLSGLCILIGSLFTWLTQIAASMTRMSSPTCLKYVAVFSSNMVVCYGDTINPCSHGAVAPESHRIRSIYPNLHFLLSMSIKPVDVDNHTSSFAGLTHLLPALHVPATQDWQAC